MAFRTIIKRFSVLLGTLAPVCFAAAPGCGDTLNYHNTYYQAAAAGGEGGAWPTLDDAGAAGLSGHSAEYPGAPHADVDAADHDLETFGKFGNLFWLAVSEEQLTALNGTEGGPPVEGDGFGDIYSPGGDVTAFADHLWITSAAKRGQTADYGKVKIKLVGQSSRRSWSKRSIPNLNIDSNEFVKGQLIGGFEHLRLNNAQIGSIFREWLSLALFRQLDYPAPEATFAWVASNVWSSDVRVPMVLVERYKRKFCTRFPELGQKCQNMWEFVGDFAGGEVEDAIGQSVFDDPKNCQFDQCDATRAKELERLLVDTPPGIGFQKATANYIDWPAFQRFQCISWVLATGDDALHNLNNVVLAEGADGKFRYLPYSTDISLGQEWYPAVALPGDNRIARGCQAEEACWQETVAVCEDVIAEFTALDPVAMLKDLHQRLADVGMLRSGDDGRYQSLLTWFKSRLETLPTELDEYREGVAECPDGQVDCGGKTCDLPENCGVCQPPVGMLADAVDAGEGGAPGFCPAIENYVAPE